MSEPLLSVEELHVRRGSVEVLKGIRLEVQPGEIVALIGANGAGKSTTLMAVSGILKPSRGSIRFRGRSLHGLPAEQVVGQGITQVPEGRRIFPRLTVRENLQAGASLRRDRDGVAQEMERVMQLFPVLRDRRGQLAGTLSGGEQQMLALARGLMARPVCSSSTSPRSASPPRWWRPSST